MKISKIILILIVLFLSNSLNIYSSKNTSEERGLMLESFIIGDGPNNYLGKSISSDGDFNGDGINDLVIGANGAGKNNEGRIYIFYGKKLTGNLSASTADLIINGENRQDNFGWSISFDSDLNDDGKTDLLVGALTADNGFDNSGTVYLFYGKNVTGEIDVSKADKRFIGIRNLHLFGWSISAGGDINDDGKADIVIGAAGNTKYADRSMAGCVHIFFGKKFKDTVFADEAEVIITGDKGRDQLGNSVSMKGDVTGDGIDDLQRRQSIPFSW